jgi:hypothetical protein
MKVNIRVQKPTKLLYFVAVSEALFNLYEIIGYWFLLFGYYSDPEFDKE